MILNINILLGEIVIPVEAQVNLLRKKTGLELEIAFNLKLKQNEKKNKVDLSLTPHKYIHMKYAVFRTVWDRVDPTFDLTKSIYQLSSAAHMIIYFYQRD